MWAHSPFSASLNLGQAQLGSFTTQSPTQRSPVSNFSMAGQKGAAFSAYQQAPAAQGYQKIPQQMQQPKRQSLDLSQQQSAQQQQMQQQQQPGAQLGQFQHATQPQQLQQPLTVPQQTFHQPSSTAPQPVAQDPPQLRRESLRESATRQSQVSQAFQNQQKPVAHIPNLALDRHGGHSGQYSVTGNGNFGDKKREAQLEKRVHDLELQLRQKDSVIQNLQFELKKAGVNAKVIAQKSKTAGSPTSKPQPNVIDAKPLVPYAAVNRNDDVDVRLEEFYNSTNSAIQFERINRGWYKFGKTLVELELINHKLMAKTDEGWNRGKYGDIEKFLVTFEPIEREAAGIPFD